MPVRRQQRTVLWKRKIKKIELHIMMKADESLKETDTNAIKFEAAFYADLSLIKQLVKSKEDLIIAIPISKDYCIMWNNQSVSVSILDMLNWLVFGFYE